MSASDGLQVDDVIQVLSILANESNLRVTVNESLKGGLIAGVATVLGGLLGGRMGLALGAAVGGIGAVAMTENFQSVGSVILNMNQEDKEKLFTKVQQCMNRASLTDIVKFQEAINDPDKKSIVLKAIIDHVENQLQLHIVD